MASKLFLLVWGVGVVACTKPSPSVPSTETSAEPFKVHAALSGLCVERAPCEASLTLEASAPYHLNPEYPYRFQAKESPSLTFLGEDPTNPTLFAAAAKAFQPISPQIGVMRVRFRPQQSGTHTLVGDYRLSVCSVERCLVESRPMALTVDVQAAPTNSPL